MEELVYPLLKWFQKNKRDLEWRGTTSAYPILVSEIMLQQTRAQTVRPYFIRFMKELPDFYALANCPDEKLLKLWEGLGYYSRARNLKKCALEIIQTYEGKFPNTYEQAIRLPGIGMYACGAILSRAYHLPYAAIDGNALRVLTRYQCSDKDISKEKTKLFFKQEIEKIIPKNCGDFNEALMELGATVCMPKITLCEDCPLAQNCLAKQKNMQLQYPKKEKKKEKKVYEYTCIFVTDGNQYILIPKPTNVLKDLPSPFMVSSFLTGNEASEYISSLGFEVINELTLPEKTHTFTHQKWYMKGYKISVHHLLDYPAYAKEEILNQIGVPTCFKQFFDELF